MRAGDRLVVGESNGRIVFYAWLMTGSFDLSGGRLIPTAPGRAYSYMVYTDEDYRGKRIAPAYYAWASRTLVEEGCTEILCHVLRRNVSSIVAHTRAGFAAAGCFWQIRLGRKIVFFVPHSLRSRLRQSSGPGQK